MNKKFDIISMVLIIVLTIILIAFVFNYFTKSNETTPADSSFNIENINVDVPSVSGSNTFVSSTPIENDKTVEDKHIIDASMSGDIKEVENQESGETNLGIIDNIKENDVPSSNQPQKDINPLIITSNDNVSDKEKKEVLKELDETLMDLLDVIETVKTVDESRLPTDGSEVQP